MASCISTTRFKRRQMQRVHTLLLSSVCPTIQHALIRAEFATISLFVLQPSRKSDSLAVLPRWHGCVAAVLPRASGHSLCIDFWGWTWHVQPPYEIPR